MKLRFVPRVLLLVAALVALGTTPAGAAGTHHAAVIVDTGSGVHRVVITFGEDSITGVDAAERIRVPLLGRRTAASHQRILFGLLSVGMVG